MAGKPLSRNGTLCTIEAPLAHAVGHRWQLQPGLCRLAVALHTLQSGAPAGLRRGQGNPAESCRPELRQRHSCRLGLRRMGYLRAAHTAGQHSQYPLLLHRAHDRGHGSEHGTLASACKQCFGLLRSNKTKDRSHGTASELTEKYPRIQNPHLYNTVKYVGRSDWRRPVAWLSLLD